MVINLVTRSFNVIIKRKISSEWCKTIMSKDDDSKEDENKKIFQENFAPFHGRSKWVMIIIFALLAFYIIASNLN